MPGRYNHNSDQAAGSGTGVVAAAACGGAAPQRCRQHRDRQGWRLGQPQAGCAATSGRRPGLQEQPPTWVTFVPSRTRPTLVRDLADQAGRLLGVAVHAVVERVRPHARPQAELANSFYQYRNAHDAFVVTGTVPHGPVLVVDDVRGSGWTLTTVAAQLRDAGAGPAHPLVLLSGWPTPADPIRGE